MLADYFFNFQGGDLFASTLDDVNALAPLYPIHAAIFHGYVAGAKPTIMKGIRGGVWPPPVLPKDAWTTHFELTRRAGRNAFAVLVNQSHLDCRERSTHRPWDPVSIKGIRQRHTNLSHAEPLEESMAGDFSPPLK
jgi:hypothetical protein